MRVNSKKPALRGNHPQRDEQFKYIDKLKSEILDKNLAVLSFDVKKKEQIGKYKNPGTAWVKVPYLIYDHDFKDAAIGKLIPLGIYDCGKNKGHVVCGTSLATSEFVVDALEIWWLNIGRYEYPQKELLLLCDAGPPNSYRSYKWKWMLQLLVDKYQLTIHVCHYPPGTSKWNPIEHRLFSPISKNWQGIPLETYEIALELISNARTSTGLTVESVLCENETTK